MPTAQPSSPPRLIKRYANRKLYDTQDSCYVTLDRVAEMVRGGDEVRIVDNGTKEDLTNVTLAQIIYEEEKNGDGRARSVGNLREFIQARGAKIRETIEGTRDAGVGIVDAGVGYVKEMVDEVQRIADDQVQGVLGRAITHVQHLQAEISRLQGRIDELEGRLRQAAKPSETPPADE